VLLVALPPLADGDVLTAAGALDAVLLLARSDATPKVRLQAGLEALDTVGTVAQVVLIDDREARRSGGSTTPVAERTSTEPGLAGSDQVGPGASPAVAAAESATEPAIEPSAQVDDPLPTDAEVSPEVSPEAGTLEARTAEAGTDGPAPPVLASDEVDLDAAAHDPETTAALDRASEADDEPGDEPGDEARAEVAAPERSPAVEEPATEVGPAAEQDPATDPAPSAPEPPADRWAGPPTSTPRAELERPPSPSVRVVRGVPPTPKDGGPPVPERTVAASPRDPEVVAGAAAASLAARLASSSPPEGRSDAAPAEPAEADEPDTEARQDAEAEDDHASAVEAADDPDPTADLTADADPTADADADAAEPPAADPAADEVPTEDDPTDEIPAVRDDRLAAPQPEDDPLRTTAQLAILMDELEAPGRGRDLRRAVEHQRLTASPALRTWGVLAVLLTLLAGCGGGDDRLEWRDLTMSVPEGWVVFEEEETRLSLANEPLGAQISEEERPTGEVVAVFLTHRTGAAPGPWRDQIEASGAALEVDEAIEVDGVPATRLQFLTPGAAGTAETRELVVVVPSREVELLAQPVPRPGSTDGPATFDRSLGTFEALLDSIRWGAPVVPPDG
jgi:hypothetical protein